MFNSMIRKRSTYRSALLIGAASAALSLGVNAQDTTSNSDDEEFSFEEIIVTAGRRSQSLQDVPASVVAITPENFTVKGLQQLKDVLNYIPGIQYTDSGALGRGTISARGVPQSASTPVFGIYIDDTPLTSNSSFSNGANTLLDGLLLDVERIEIIKGPQGTLFGATSVGGLLRYISRDPALNEFRASASADISNVKDGEWGQTFTGRVSAPIIKDKLGITVSAYYQEQAGYVDSIDPATGEFLLENGNGGEAQGYSADLLFTPTDELDVRLKYIKQDNSSQLTSSVDLAGTDTKEGLYGDYASPSKPGPIDLDFEMYSGTLTYDFGGFSVTSTTSHTEYVNATTTDLTASYAGLTDLLAGRDPGTTTSVPFVASSGAKKIIQEVRLTSADSDKFEWIVGFYYTNEDTFNFQDVQAEPAFNLLYADFPSEYTEYAGFGNFTYYFNDKFDISGGVRISKNKLRLNTLITGVLAGATDTQGDPIEDTVDTYLLATRYRVNDDLSLYSRIASGYRPAQTNIPVIDPLTGEDISSPVIESDKAWSFEVGAKGTAADGMVDFDVAVWAITWDNFQASIIANGVSTGDNAEDGLTAYGFESMLAVRPVKDLTIIGNLGYTSSTLNSDEPGLGGVKGENYQRLPNWKGSIQWNYAFDVSSDWTGTLGGGVRYVGGFQSSFSQSTSSLNVPVEDRMITDMNVGISNGSVHLGVYATNLFNNRALLSRADNIIGGVVPVSTGILERPRTIGANVRFDF